MNDKEFENRMEMLHKDYDSIPLQSSTKEILQHIAAKEPKRKRGVFKWLPIAMSAAAFFLIIGLLGSYYYQTGFNQGSAPAKVQPPSNEEVKKEKDRINKLYEERVQKLENSLHFPEAWQYAFVQEAISSKNNFIGRTSFRSKEELEQNASKAAADIELKLLTPSEQLQQFDELKKEKKPIPMASFMTLLSKQDQLIERYIESTKKYAEKEQAGGRYVTASDLNEQGSSQENAELHEILQNGFAFYDEGEGFVSVKIDYNRLKSQYGELLDKETRDFLDFMLLNPAMTDGSLNVKPDELKNRLLNMENFILRHQSFEEIYKLKKLYALTLNQYLTAPTNPNTGEDGKQEAIQSFESLLKEEKQSQTAGTVREYYSKLKDYLASNAPQPDITEQRLPDFLGNVNSQQLSFYNVFPLTERLQSFYQQVKKADALSEIDGLPGLTAAADLDIPRVYWYALYKKDYETAYKLLSGSVRNSLTLQAFKQKILDKGEDFQKLSNMAKDLGSEEGSVQLYLEDGKIYTIKTAYEGEFKVIDAVE
ncbi:hypothetical protein LRR81_16035 [Metabacillus sp. GX 13764]|uniref:hypothetical protein n=1 Tax=Metabacillus kandeliae TaxID=2900151 RepID=UPI001E4FFCC3|nr:hypothetical protein [Metabacillus kandeliae]MCD7035754.1 hypothetical protein [Metabacillus kandeliae]